MSRLAVTFTMLGILFLWGSHPASAYVWKCTTPQGDIWTSQPNPSDDCQEYDEQYNPDAAPPVTSSPQSAAVPPVVTTPAPPPYVGAYVYPPYYPPYYYAPGYYGPGVVIIRPPFGYPHRGFYGGFYGRHWHSGHFRR